MDESEIWRVIRSRGLPWRCKRGWRGSRYRGRWARRPGRWRWRAGAGGAATMSWWAGGPQRCANLSERPLPLATSRPGDSPLVPSAKPQAYRSQGDITKAAVRCLSFDESQHRCTSAIAIAASSSSSSHYKLPMLRCFAI